ncbi:hypothetical protein [Streptomyces virginiae]
MHQIPAGPPPLRMETVDVGDHPDPDAESERLMRAEPARPTAASGSAGCAAIDSWVARWWGS